MLQLRPICENCAEPLPPDSADARICSFECTFCRRCVDDLLANVCPNCGGGFQPRPVRPKHDWRNGNCLGRFPATEQRVHRPVDRRMHALLAEQVAATDPANR